MFPKIFYVHVYIVPRKASHISSWSDCKCLSKQHKNLKGHFPLVASANLGTECGLVILTLNQPKKITFSFF